MPLVAVSFAWDYLWNSTPFVGDVYKNVADNLNMLGEDALLALVSLIIILAIPKKVDSFLRSL